MAGRATPPRCWTRAATSSWIGSWRVLPSSWTDLRRPSTPCSAFDSVLALTGTDRRAVRAVGLDTPGPTSADGVISSKGSTNFSAPAWRGFDVRSGLEDRLQLPVVYNNDGKDIAPVLAWPLPGPRPE